MSSISENLQAVNDRISQYARAANRPSNTVQLLAVSKTFPCDAIEEAINAGQRAFGENYCQEAVEKIHYFRTQSIPNLEWHFIGPIQSNKTSLLASHFDWIHSVDRLSIAQRLDRARPSDLPPLNVCIQVNISGEASKSGVAPDQLAELVDAIKNLTRIKLRGLMAIPAASADFEFQRKSFQSLRFEFEKLQASRVEIDTLSMGMSADMEAAILEGSTIVRIGSAIFGNRKYV